MKKIILYAAVALGLGTAPVHAQEPKEILNVSYDIARELYEQVNKAFVADWKARLAKTSLLISLMPVHPSRHVPFSKAWKPTS